jgi:hypothetical protein
MFENFGKLTKDTKCSGSKEFETGTVQVKSFGNFEKYLVQINVTG